MAKRRTRKEKERARHSSTIRWKPQDNKADSQPKAATKTESNTKIPKKTKEETDYSYIKRDILKSILIAVFIIGVVIAIYIFS